MVAIKACKNSWLNRRLQWTGPAYNNQWPSILVFGSTIEALSFLQAHRKDLEPNVGYHEISIVPLPDDYNASLSH